MIKKYTKELYDELKEIIEIHNALNIVLVYNDIRKITYIYIPNNTKYKKLLNILDKYKNIEIYEYEQVKDKFEERVPLIIYNSKYEDEIDKFKKIKKVSHYKIGKLLGYQCPKKKFTVNKIRYRYGIEIDEHHIISFVCRKRNDKYLEYLQKKAKEIEPIAKKLNFFEVTVSFRISKTLEYIKNVEL